MKLLSIHIILLSFFAFHLNAQPHTVDTVIYLFHGQGSDSRLFSKFDAGEGYDTVHIRYPAPTRKESLNEYALRLLPQIDTAEPYVLLGVSLGGMMCSVLSDTLHPMKTILVSSAACTREIPVRYRFMRFFPIHRIIPRWLYKWGAFIAQPLVEPDRNKEKELFKDILKGTDPHFLKQTTRMIVSWERNCNKNRIVHIHGTADHTLPLKRVKADYLIREGSHMMMLTRAEVVNETVSHVLRDE